MLRVTLFIRILLLFPLAVLWITPSALAQVRVFAAASLTELVVQAGEQFSGETGIEVIVSTAGSSILARQIIGGAPVDIYISANSNLVEIVQHQAGFSTGQALFFNRLIVVAPPSNDNLLVKLEDLPALVGNGRLALGDPAHIPAGIYAKQALEAAGVWQSLQDNLAPASNVRGALQLVAAGAAPAGIVYASDIIGTNMSKVLEINSDLHNEITYVGALGPGRENGPAAQFLDYLGGPSVHNIALDLGFALDGEN